MTRGRQLHLNTNILDAGKHPGAWRAQDDPFSFVDIDYFLNIARISERGTFDAVFLSDGGGLHESVVTKPWQALEPSVLLTAIAAATEHIGLIGTASTTYNDPYNLARRFASLDHVSRGRAALNVVTSSSPDIAANYGIADFPDHVTRYGRAEEFVDVLLELWDSWEDGALVGDRVGDVFVDNARVHRIDHRGPHFSVRGPLCLPRGPQGRPVLVQAGSSQVGKSLAARIADIVFTAQTTFPASREFYDEIHRLAEGFGRPPESVVILPGLFPIVGGTEEEAWRRKAELDALFPFDRELPRLAHQLGLDPDDLRLDELLPEHLASGGDLSTRSQGFFEATVRLARSERLTVRDLLLSNGGGHRQVVGSPEQIADDIELWFRERAADGFNLNFDVFPSGLEAFVEHVVPELRRRGIFRSEYTGSTLRGHLGLERPPNRFEASSDQSDPSGQPGDLGDPFAVVAN
jgi:FMN-dependent oxidoreductase (nitrilotriacetate monooxygenase family)